MPLGRPFEVQNSRSPGAGLGHRDRGAGVVLRDRVVRQRLAGRRPGPHGQPGAVPRARAGGAPAVGLAELRPWRRRSRRRRHRSARAAPAAPGGVGGGVGGVGVGGGRRCRSRCRRRSGALSAPSPGLPCPAAAFCVGGLLRGRGRRGRGLLLGGRLGAGLGLRGGLGLRRGDRGLAGALLGALAGDLLERGLALAGQVDRDVLGRRRAARISRSFSAAISVASAWAASARGDGRVAWPARPRRRAGPARPWRAGPCPRRPGPGRRWRRTACSRPAATVEAPWKAAYWSRTPSGPSALIIALSAVRSPPFW